MDDIQKFERLTDAWRLAWRLRCCPPENLLSGDRCAELEAHLEICPYCRLDLEHIDPTVPEFPLPISPASPNQPRVGEIRSLRPETGGWGPKRRYYNPPLVVITDVISCNAVHVCQIYDDSTLAGPDDIALGQEYAGFAEPWNCYTLATRDLGPTFGNVADEIIDRIQTCRTIDLQPGSLLWFFRQMEVETGFFFAKKSVDWLLETDEQKDTSFFQDLPLKYGSREEFLADLRQFPLILPANENLSFPELLAGTMPTDELLPLAAAGDWPADAKALLFTVDNGQICKVEAVHITVTACEDDGQVLHLTGSSPLWAQARYKWIFHWKEEEQFIAPLPGMYGADKGVFWVSFPRPSRPGKIEEHFIVRILKNR